MKGYRLLLAALLLLGLVPFAQASDYVIGDGDVLAITVWGSEQLSGEVTVRPDGRITLPAIGDLEASGETPEGLGKKLETVAAKLVHKPIVTVSIVRATNNRVYVSGGGVPSEVVLLPGRTSLFKFLCRFGDLTHADLKRAFLLRSGEKVAVDMNALMVEGDFSQDMQLQPEDVLFIPPNLIDRVYVVGAVKEPKVIPYRRGLKILDAILEAGGFGEYADLSHVSILRGRSPKLGDKANEIPVDIEALIKKRRFDLNLALKPGDYVAVRESMF